MSSPLPESAGNTPVDPPLAQATGLRERSKARRRADIRRTAVRLFAERGFENTTIAEIAEAAEVAPRTVAGYFPAKVDLATSFADEIAARVSAIFAADPQGDLLELLDRWLLEEERVMDRELGLAVDAMFAANPGLRAVSSAHVTEAFDTGRNLMIDRAGLSADDPMVEIRGAAVAAAAGSYLGVMIRGGTSAQLHQSFVQYLRTLIDPDGVT